MQIYLSGSVLQAYIIGANMDYNVSEAIGDVCIDSLFLPA